VEAREERLAPRRKVFGELRAVRRTTVAAEEGGIVREFRVSEGSRVRAGEPVARLDGARIDLELRVLEANTAVARATLAERELGVRRYSRLAQAGARFHAMAVVARLDQRSQVTSGASTDVKHPGTGGEGKRVVPLDRAWRRLVPRGEIGGMSVVELSSHRVHNSLWCRRSGVLLG
jgi:hypothetical protein